jgi:hypothetical protein
MSESIDLRVDLIEAERQIDRLREDVRCADEACGRLRAVIALRNTQIADITKARDEAAGAYAERVRVLREALELTYEIYCDSDCDCHGCSKVRAALEATK